MTIAPLLLRGGKFRHLARSKAIEPAQAPVAPVRMQEEQPDHRIEQTLRLRPANSLESAPAAFGEAASAQQEYQNRRQQQHAEQNGEDYGFKE